MRNSLRLLIAVGLAVASPALAQPSVYSPAAPDIRVNIAALQAQMLSGPYGLSTLAIPSAPLASGTGSLSLDSSGGLEFANQFGVWQAFGATYQGSSNYLWSQVPWGFGQTTNSSSVGNSNVFISRTDNGTAGGPALSVSHTIGANVTGATTTTSIFARTGAVQTGNALGLHVVVERDFGMMGNPFTANFSAVDLSGLTSDIVGGATGLETDVGAGGTDVALERSALVAISREQAHAQNGSYTTNAYGLWIKPAAYNNPTVTGPSAFINGTGCRTETAWPGSGIQSCLSSDGGNLYATNFTSASINVRTSASATSGSNTLTYNIAGDGQNVQAFDPISDPGHCIPAGASVQAIASNNTTNVATITLSGNLSCSIASNVQLTVINAYQHGIDFNGFATMDAANIIDQFGPEFFAFNGVTVGTPTGGTCGVGCLNVQVIKQQGVSLGAEAFQASLSGQDASGALVTPSGGGSTVSLASLASSIMSGSSYALPNASASALGGVQTTSAFVGGETGGVPRIDFLAGLGSATTAPVTYSGGTSTVGPVLTVLAAASATNSTAITTEATSRAAGDAANSTAITTEAGTRASGDATNAAAITTEATTRATADTTNATAISNETTARIGSENTITASVNTAQAVANAALPMTGGPVSGSINMTGHTITSLVTGSPGAGGTNAATQAYADAAAAAVSGGSGGSYTDASSTAIGLVEITSALASYDSAHSVAHAALGLLGTVDSPAGLDVSLATTTLTNGLGVMPVSKAADLGLIRIDEFASAPFYGDVQTAQCKMTSSGSTLTFAASSSYYCPLNFGAGDVGKHISIDGVGATPTTGGIATQAIVTNGSYPAGTAIPTFTLSGVGSGTGYAAFGVMKLIGETLQSSGTGCPNGTGVIFYNGTGGYDPQYYTANVTGGSINTALTPIPNPVSGAAQFTGSISGSTLTTSALVGTNPIVAGTALFGASVPRDINIVSGSGSTWQLSRSVGTIASESMSSGGPGLLQKNFPAAGAAGYYKLVVYSSASQGPAAASGQCLAPPQISTVWDLDHWASYRPGANYPSGVSYTIGAVSGASAATPGAMTVNPITPPLSTTITGFTNSSTITVATAPSVTSTGPVAVNLMWGHDDGPAVRAAQAAQAARAAIGVQSTVFFPGNAPVYIVTMPSMMVHTGGIMGLSQALKSVVLVDPSAGGRLFECNENTREINNAWSGYGSNTATTVNYSGSATGCLMANISVVGWRDGADFDAFDFSGRNDFARAYNLDAYFVPGRCLGLGVAGGSATWSWFNESMVDHIRCRGDGQIDSVTYPVVDLTSTGPTGSGSGASNTDFISDITAYNPRGPGLSEHDEGNGPGITGIFWNTLRFEGGTHVDGPQATADLIIVGSIDGQTPETNQGSESQQNFDNLFLLSPAQDFFDVELTGQPNPVAGTRNHDIYFSNVVPNGGNLGPIYSVDVCGFCRISSTGNRPANLPFDFVVGPAGTGSAPQVQGLRYDMDHGSYDAGGFQWAIATNSAAQVCSLSGQCGDPGDLQSGSQILQGAVVDYGSLALPNCNPGIGGFLFNDGLGDPLTCIAGPVLNAQDGIATAGSSLTTATQITGTDNRLTTCSSGGVRLPPRAQVPIGGVWIYDRCGAGTKVFPDTSGDTIEGGTAGAYVGIASGSDNHFVPMGTADWVQ